MIRIAVIFIFYCSFSQSEVIKQNSGVVDWFGDPRDGKPEDNFYDLIYDDTGKDLHCKFQKTTTLHPNLSVKTVEFCCNFFAACSTSMKSNGVANYILIGSVIKTVFVDASSQCLTECHKESRCKSVNFYPGRLTAKNNVCEMNEVDQSFNPTSMLRYEGANYYDNIECDSKKQKSTGTSKKNDERTDCRLARTTTFKVLRFLSGFKNLSAKNNDNDAAASAVTIDDDQQHSFLRQSLKQIPLDKNFPLAKQSDN